MNTVNIGGVSTCDNRRSTNGGGMPEKRSYHHGALAAAMVEAALNEVRLHGADRLSLRAIAQALKVSPSAAYNHFQDKEALLRAVGERGITMLGERMMDALANHPGDSDDDARARFTSLGRAYLSFATDETHLFQLTFGPMCAGHPVDPGQPGAYQLLHETLNELDGRKLLNPGIREGLDMTVWAATHGMASLLVEGLVAPAMAEAFIASMNRIVTTAEPSR